MAKFKVTIVLEVEAEDMYDAQALAVQFAERGNDSSDGEVGDVLTQDVEEIL